VSALKMLVIVGTVGSSQSSCQRAAFSAGSLFRPLCIRRRPGNRPVMNAARLGEQTGDAV
jgi:hypothetical protein